MARVTDEIVLYYLAGCIIKYSVTTKTSDHTCERFLKAVPNDVSFSTHQFMAMLMAHDVSNQFFGNATLSWYGGCNQGSRGYAK